MRDATYRHPCAGTVLLPLALARFYTVLNGETLPMPVSGSCMFCVSCGPVDLALALASYKGVPRGWQAASLGMEHARLWHGMTFRAELSPDVSCPHAWLAPYSWSKRSTVQPLAACISVGGYDTFHVLSTGIPVLGAPPRVLPVAASRPLLRPVAVWRNCCIRAHCCCC